MSSMSQVHLAIDQQYLLTNMLDQTAADQKTRQIQLLKARVSGTITQRRAALGQELRELQAFLTVEAPGDVQSQQEREKRMEQFKLKMTAYKSQESDLNRLNAMSDQEFAVWLEDQRNRSAFLIVSLVCLLNRFCPQNEARHWSASDFISTDRWDTKGPIIADPSASRLHDAQRH